ncbi:efflux RND transporter permease subunit [Brumimicrobium aurantiacum]|uniref:AcrB/AcrD/AcrF family protein n=1 Tax=Brumimicrobium aurantiacum TaxID=1737063 RepID=A0A3E1EUT4_9FLAO|nr:efflux RND transporter permease subunit [Brumimicrobium aurantiacum]RFC53288.1 AcrB/AcrD/AcrF family protein [Brumimicrobium aurantiacum]
MSISTTSINRPVLAIVMSIVIVIFGAIGFYSLGVREFPSVDPPIITVTTNYSGANADIIESQITEPLEEAVNQVQGIRTMTSVSSDGRSTITVEFNLDLDLDNAANDIRDKVSGAIRQLPDDADPPIVAKSDADAETIFSLTVQSDNRSLLELTDIGINLFKERLQTISGISRIYLWGEKLFSMKLMLEPNKLTAKNITATEVQAALLRENIELPSGRIEGDDVELTIRTFGRLTTEEEFNNLIIREENDEIIRLKDIGSAEMRPENERTILRGNKGVPMIGIAIQPQPGANYIEIVDEIYAKINQISADLPEDIHLGVALDTTENIRKSIAEVKETVLISFLLVVLVVFMFLRNWRTTLVPIIAIPISLIGTFFIMYLMDFSINILTLLAIVLTTGLVVDDAIVVMENIYTKIERGMKPKKAAIEGANEIIFAVIATTITLTAVFMPVIFLEGLTGRLFREFGIVVAGSVIISSFVSLSLTPMMSSRLLKKTKNRSKIFMKSERFFEGLTRGYKRTLIAFMKRPWQAFIYMAIIIGSIFFFGSQLQSELAPMEDKGRLMIMSTAPEGTSYERMDEFQRKIISFVDTMEEKRNLLAVTSPGFGSSISTNTGFVRMNLVNKNEREKSQSQLANEISTKLKDFNFARTFVVQEQTIGGGRMSGLPVQYVLQAPNLKKLEEILPDFLDKARNSPVFQMVDINLKFNKPELQVTINREKANTVGVSVLDIAQTMQLYFSGQRYGYFIKDGKQYEVIGQAMKEFRNEPKDLQEINVRSKSGELIPLSNLVDIKDESSPPQLFRYNRYVSATVSAAPVPGKTIGDGIAEMDKIAEEILDPSFSTSLAGTSKEFAESGGSLIFAFGLALVLVYLVLSAQFESFRDPFTIMLTVPLALAGAVLTLWLFDQTLNIFSQIGIIVLVGLVTKNGILIVEFANQRKKAGLTLKSAIIDASSERFRPILMTSLATILGALPIALALGDAATSRIPMGLSIIGGLTFSLVLTLYIIPGIYIYISSKYKGKTETKELT